MITMILGCAQAFAYAHEHLMLESAAGFGDADQVAPDAVHPAVDQEPEFEISTVSDREKEKGDEDEGGPVAISADDISAPSLRALVDDNRTVDGIDLQSARQSLERNVHALDVFLSTAEEDREASWRKFLGWEAMVAQLKKSKPSYRTMDLVFQRYDSGRLGLFHPKFRAVWGALRRYNQRLKLVNASERQAEATKSQIAALIDECEAAFKEDEATAEDLRRKLRWDDIAKLAGEETLEGTSYRNLLRYAGRLNAVDTDPIDETPFRKLSDEINAWGDYLFLTRDQTLTEQFNERIAKLDELVKRFEEEGSNDQAGQLADELAWLDDLGVATGVADTIRTRYRRDNLLVEASDNILKVVLTQERTDTQFQAICFQGAYVRGIANSCLAATPTLLPCDNGISIRLDMRGKSVANTVGTKRKVNVCNRVVGYPTACKRLHVSLDGITASPACTDFCVDQQLTGVCIARRCGNRLLSRLAARRTERLKPESQAVSRTIGRYKLAKLVDREVGEQLDGFNDRIDEITTELRERGFYPDNLKLRSTCERVYATGLHAPADNFGAWNDPPVITFCSELNASVHQSIVNSLLKKELGGRYFDQDTIVKMLEDAGMEIPEELTGKSADEDDDDSSDDDEEPLESWSITLDKRLPASVTFEDGNVRVAIRGRRFTREGTTLNDPMEIVAVYRPAIVAGEIEASLVGEVEVNFVGQESPLSARQITYKTFIRRKVGSLFKERFTEDDLPGTETVQSFLDNVTLEHLQIEDNWLAAGVDINDESLKMAEEDEGPKPLVIDCCPEFIYERKGRGCRRRAMLIECRRGE